MKAVRIGFAVGSAFTLSVVLSAVHPWGNPRKGTQAGTLLEGSSAPEDVRRVLATKCGDCHSQGTHYPAYSYLAPVSWMVEHDVQEGREHLELSRWKSLSDADRMIALSKIASEVNAGQMPPKSYLMIHRGARLSDDEQKLIYDWAHGERKRLRQEQAHRSDASTAEVTQVKP